MDNFLGKKLRKAAREGKIGKQQKNYIPKDVEGLVDQKNVRSTISRKQLRARQG